jgi:mono/diheme cytochrome c family protein
MTRRIAIVAIISLAAAASRFTVPASARQESRSVWDGVYSEEQAARGRALYSKECANCHGQQLEGADMSPALTGPSFTADWDGMTVGDLFDRIRITMPADRPGSLQRQEIVDILAHLLNGNQFPPGQTELPREVQALKQIMFKASKP